MSTGARRPARQHVACLPFASSGSQSPGWSPLGAGPDTATATMDTPRTRTAHRGCGAGRKLQEKRLPAALRPALGLSVCPRLSPRQRPGDSFVPRSQTSSLTLALFGAQVVEQGYYSSNSLLAVRDYHTEIQLSAFSGKAPSSRYTGPERLLRAQLCSTREMQEAAGRPSACCSPPCSRPTASCQLLLVITLRLSGGAGGARFWPVSIKTGRGYGIKANESWVFRVKARREGRNSL